MEKSSTPACMRIFRSAKLLRHASVGVVNLSREVKYHADVSLQPLLQCIEVSGQCKLSHADEGRGEMRGKNCDQGIKGLGGQLERLGARGGRKAGGQL